MELTPAWVAVVLTGAIQIIGFVALFSTMRADLRNLKEWVKRIDADVDEHIRRHPGPTTFEGDN